MNAPEKSANLTTDSLVATFAGAMHNPFESNGVAPSGVLPIWLPGALEIPGRNADDLIARTNLKLKAGARVSGWFFVPQAANVLHIEWQAAVPDALGFDVASKTSFARLSKGANYAADLDLKTATVGSEFPFLQKAMWKSPPRSLKNNRDSETFCVFAETSLCVKCSIFFLFYCPRVFGNRVIEAPPHQKLNRFFAFFFFLKVLPSTFFAA